MQLAPTTTAYSPLAPPAYAYPSACPHPYPHPCHKQREGKQDQYEYDALLSDFGATLASLGLPHPSKQNIVLAVSGGGDSMGMAVLFADWHKRFAKQNCKPHPSLSALVVDHGIRPESAEEAQSTKRQLLSLGIPTTIASISHPPPKHGIQAWARQHRYHLLMTHARHKNAILALAHQHQDQIETIEMRLMKKSGLRGLAGMAVDGWRDGVRVIRPCLTMSRQALAMAATHKGVAITHDPSNSDTRFLRPRLRAEQAHRSRGKTGVVDSQLLRLGVASQRITAMLDAQVSPFYSVSPWGYGLVARHTLQKPSNPSVFCHSARLLAQHVHGAKYVPNEASFRSLHHRLTSALSANPSNPFTTTLAGCEWRIDARMPHHIIVMREAEIPLPAIAIPPTSRTIIFDRRWLIRLPATAPAPKRVEALGKKRFAELRRSIPHYLAKTHANIASRAFWSLPVIIDTPPQSLYSEHHTQDRVHCRDTIGGNAPNMRQNMTETHTMTHATPHATMGQLVLEDGARLPYISEGRGAGAQDACPAHHPHEYSAIFLGMHTAPPKTRSIW
ncbi:MAG: tRNA lysidine(34) synthetase TilS [Proteobacteria bacterium]|nr:tRNA lysidine(34) synthetase TilS [Pseudomonadota bacterium]